jgi:hypothetical protein
MPDSTSPLKNYMHGCLASWCVHFGETSSAIRVAAELYAVQKKPFYLKLCMTTKFVNTPPSTDVSQLNDHNSYLIQQTSMLPVAFVGTIRSRLDSTPPLSPTTSAAFFGEGIEAAQQPKAKLVLDLSFTFQTPSCSRQRFQVVGTNHQRFERISVLIYTATRAKATNPYSQAEIRRL